MVKNCLAVCQLYQKEFTQALKISQTEKFDLETFPPRFGQAKNDMAMHPLIDRLMVYDNVLMLGCQCWEVDDDRLQDERFNIHVYEQCFEFFLPRDLLYHYQQNRYHIVTVGWVEQWRQWMNIWGFDATSAPEFFQEFADKFVVLDTGVAELSIPEIVAMSEFAGLGYEILPVGISHLTLLLKDLLRKQQAQKQAELEQELRLAQQRTADYAMAMDLLSTLTEETDVEILYQQIEHTFAILFAARSVVILRVEDDALSVSQVCGAEELIPQTKAIVTSMLEKRERQRMTENGFVVAIHANNKPLGFVHVIDVGFTNFIKQYMNLAPYLADIMGLALANAQQYDELQWQEKRYRTLFEQNTDSVVLVHPQTGAFIEFNNHAYDDLGYTPEAFSQLRFVDTSETHATEITHHLDAVVKAQGEPQTIEIEQKTVDGIVLVRLVTSSVIEVNQEHLVLSIWHDLTERIIHESARRKSEYLRIELEKQREINELKSKFITTVSHEFRTPLTVILASNQLLEQYHERITPERRTIHHERIEKNVQHMVGLIEDILKFQTMYTLDTDVQRQEFNLQTLLKNIISDYDRPIQLIDNSTDGYVYSDPSITHHILSNIIDNAVKFSENDTITVSVDRYEGTVVIHVTDQGIGIPQAQLSRIKEPFFRADNAINIAGIGMGLTIAEQALDKINGTLKITSGDEGTTVRITIPDGADISNEDARPINA
jgi:PAS domain S-box-containing protein